MKLLASSPATEDKKLDAPTDAELVEQFRAGDKHAFVELIDKYLGLIQYCCRKSVSNEHIIEELVQETIYGALRGFNSFDINRSFKKWLTGITFKTVAGYLRHKSKGPPALKIAVEKGNIRKVHEAGDQDPSKSSQDKEMKDAIQAAIDKLPEPKGTFVVLHHLDGLPIKDIVKAYPDWKEQEVVYQLRKARELLGKSLQGFADLSSYGNKRKMKDKKSFVAKER